MLDAELPDERRREIITRMREQIERDGTWTAEDEWGRRKLAYEIDHKGEAYYYLVTFTTTPATLDEVSRVLRITDGVMRHMAVRLPEGTMAAPVSGNGGEAPEEAASVAADAGGGSEYA